MFEPIDRVMKNKRGGAVPRRTQIAGQDHMLSYITPTEAEILMQLGGSGEPGPAGIPAFFSGPTGAGIGPGETSSSYGGGDKGGGASSTDDKSDDGKSYSDLGMSPGRAQAQFGKIGPAVAAGFTSDQFSDPAVRTQALADYRNLGKTKGLFGRTTYKSTYDRRMAKNYIDLITRQFGVPSQQEFNEAMGITLDNPYGYDGLFSEMFGFDPRNVSYANTISAKSRAEIANNQFSKYANPTNQPGKVGYNPAFPTAKPGFLRPGVQQKGFDTIFGRVREDPVARSPMDMAVLSGIGALGGPPGMALGFLADQLTNKTYSLPGTRAPNAALPGQPTTFVGQAFQAGKQAISDAYAAAKEAIGDLADLLSPEEARAVATATPAEQAQIQAEMQQGFSSPRMDAEEAFSGPIDQQLAAFSVGTTPAEAPTSSLADIQDQVQQTTEQLGLASLGVPDELSGVPMSGTVASTTLGSLVDSLPDAPSLNMQSIPGFTPDALTGNQGPFSGGFGGGDGPDRPTQGETEEDDTLYSYDPKITGGFYDYGTVGPFDDRVLVPTEEVLKDRFNIVT